MSTSVVICDDSSFARKQIARVLPPNWAAQLTFAVNGREGIEAIEQRLGDIIILDLTMPEMDGFDVLAHIRRHDLPTLAIVVSADIQPESQKRVMELGAVAFIKKPVDGEALRKVLQSYGLLESTSTAVRTDTSPADFYDWCQELANVAMGRAASLLAGVIHDGVELSIPRVNLLARSELRMLLAGMGHRGVSAVSQGFIGAGISGEALLFFDDAHVPSLARAVDYEGEDQENMLREVVMEVGNVLSGAFLKGMSEQLDIKLSQGHPQLSLHHNHEGLSQPALPEQTLAIELSYNIGQEHIHCDQLLLLTEGSIAPLKQRMELALQ